jgi:hypothetical protein
MSDPRRRRAEQLREMVLREVRHEVKRWSVGISAETLWWRLHDKAFPGSVVRSGEVRRALQSLRRDGIIRYARPLWELVA